MHVHKFPRGGLFFLLPPPSLRSFVRVLLLILASRHSAHSSSIPVSVDLYKQVSASVFVCVACVCARHVSL